MSILKRTRSAAEAEPTVPTQPTDPTVPATADNVPPAASAPSGRVPRTRTASAWAGVAAGALLAIALIVFLAQNTRSTEISFLWMTARTSLAVSLLIAAVSGVLLTLIVGTARITQLRRLIRRQRD